MRGSLARDGRCWLVLVFLIGGCAGSTQPSDSTQVHLGRGIVEGTKGYRQIQQVQRLPEGRVVSTVQGQVSTIEGGAYVIRMRNDGDLRLPLDENTRIDRPAHVGDWIEAHLDHGGRAIFIQNVDDRVFDE